MGSLLVVTGPPGAGKSTVARLLVDRYEPSVLIVGDAFFAFLARGAIEPWLPASKVQNEVVTKAAAAATARFANGGYHTVYDGIVGPWLLPTFADGAALDALDYVVLLPPVEQCLARVATRSDHGFTDADATVKMHDEFVAGVVDPRHVLVDLPAQPDAVADLIVSLRNRGTLTWRS